MSEGKIEITIGQIHFSGEGDADWVETQLNRILAQVPDLVKVAQPLSSKQQENVLSSTISDERIAKITLPLYLSEKKATSIQARKFLATSIWLESKGKNRLQTSDVTKALKESNQSRLSNPADCLNKNVAKGYCEKDGKQFFVTDEGRKSL